MPTKTMQKLNTWSDETHNAVHYSRMETAYDYGRKIRWVYIYVRRYPVHSHDILVELTLRSDMMDHGMKVAASMYLHQWKEIMDLDHIRIISEHDPDGTYFKVEVKE